MHVNRLFECLNISMWEIYLNSKQMFFSVQGIHFKFEIAEQVQARWLPAVVLVILSDAAPRHETAPNPHLLSCAFGQSTSTSFFLLLKSVLQQKGHCVSNDHPAHVSICPIFYPTPFLCCPSLLAIHGLITLLSPHSDLSIYPPPPLLSSYCV